jgi:hypothetical protein
MALLLVMTELIAFVFNVRNYKRKKKKKKKNHRNIICKVMPNLGNRKTKFKNHNQEIWVSMAHQHSHKDI